jgi:hypothetical protein
MIKLFEEYSDYVALIQDVWDKYNPALISGAYEDLTPEERKLIKLIISKMNDFKTTAEELATKIPNKEEQLKHAQQVFVDDLIRRSLPQ